ncbi:MAG: scpA [Deltaproteobacteria bacterium]|nr:scpA [Deltaproteobacteria bacterium]
MNLNVPTLEVQMEIFEGPLSVLINLIKRNKVDIFDIPISMLTDRFLEYVELVKQMNLRIAEDFIEMASLLLYIKSRMLLPREEEDPRMELVERILEYEKIKIMVSAFQELPVLGEDIFPRGQGGFEVEQDQDLMALCTLFFELIKSREERFIVIREIRPTLEEKLEALRAVLAELGVYSWNPRGDMDTSEKVATVLAMLEVVKSRLANFAQKRPFGTVVLTRR